MAKGVVDRREFRRDLNRVRRRGWDVERLHRIVRLLASGSPIPESARLHRLSGDWAGRWECHIAGDWLLVWTEDAETIYLERTGTHSDIFGR